jgi:predicted nuclease of restriction endonuclease-like RecB superfamily
MTERYGTSIAKLLPRITASDSWNVMAEILMRNRGGKMFTFEADSRELKDLLPGRGDDAPGRRGRPHVDPLYDSSTEEKFARSFLSYGTGWALKREPEPLVAGAHVLIPDFSFEKDGMKVYLEVVGFWTPEYLERKINKLNLVAGVDMIIAADESLACSKLERLRGKALVMYYKRDVPLKPIVEHLRRARGLDRQQAGREAQGGDAIELSGDVVEIEEIARRKGVAVASVRIALQDSEARGVREGERPPLHLRRQSSTR